LALGDGARVGGSAVLGGGHGGGGAGGARGGVLGGPLVLLGLVRRGNLRLRVQVLCSGVLSWSLGFRG
jgi:hypothetical protein